MRRYEKALPANLFDPREDDGPQSAAERFALRRSRWRAMRGDPASATVDSDDEARLTPSVFCRGSW